jgi:pimeloyl-ACP methyl ester carboxylesterase
MHDWGGAFGMGYAVRHPTNIKRIVFLNTGAFRIPAEILEHLPWQLMIVRKPFLGPILVRGFNAFSKFAIFMAIKNKPKRTPATKAGLLAPYNSWKNRVAVLKAVRDIPVTEDVQSHKELAYIEENLSLFKEVPKIFLWGLKDFVFNEVVLNKWLEFYPGSEVRKFEDAGHYVLEDAYERIIPEMEQFLNKHPIK